MIDYLISCFNTPYLQMTAMQGFVACMVIVIPLFFVLWLFSMRE